LADQQGLDTDKFLTCYDKDEQASRIEKDMADARAKVAESGADGAMLGRAIFGNPWLFSEQTPSREEKLRVLVEHCRAFEMLCGHKSFAVMKKHFKAYIRDFDGAGGLRDQLYSCDTANEVAELLIRHYE
jgi:tRNA-dihydrouridine synthase B